MSKNSVTQNVSTQNQSTAQYGFDHVFLGSNDYEEVSFVNTVGAADLTVISGMIAYKSSATTVDILKAATPAAAISDIVGIVKSDGEIIVLNAASKDINIGIRGDISEELLVLPGAFALDTVIPTTVRTIRDVLNGLGFHLVKGIENTKFDN